MLLDESSSANEKPPRRKADFVALLETARQGDRDALGQLLQGYANYLKILASTQLDHRLRRRLSPSDIVQEAMLAAHQDFADFRGESQGELLCWLRTILIHSLHGTFKRHVQVAKRDIRREVSLEAIGSRLEESAVNLAAFLPAKGASPSAPMRARERAVELANALSDLKPSYQEVILLRVMQGLSFEEIGVQMGRGSGAVRMLWLRALDSLRTVGNDELWLP